MLVDFLQYNHKAVTLSLLDNLVRYGSYFISNPTFVPTLTQIFFSNRAILSADRELARKSTLLLLRLCEKLQNSIIGDKSQTLIEASLNLIQQADKI